MIRSKAKMAKRMLIDAAHPEEIRIAVLNGARLEDFDFETASKREIKGNIYLAKVTRVEPSLQAAFVEYGGNRHGFLAFNEIHPDYYRIPVSDRSALEPVYETRRGGDRREYEEDDDPPTTVARPDEAEPPAGAEAPSSFEETERGETMPASQTGDDVIYDTLRPDTAEGEVAAFSTPASPTATESAPAEEISIVATETMPASDATENMPDPSSEDGADRGDAETAPSYSEEARVEPALDPTAPADGGSATPAELERPRADTVETLGGDEIEDQPRQRYRQHRHYKIQEVVKRRQILLVQVAKEERGNKGAALTTYLSLAGRYCVLMPNTPRGGGVSRRITSAGDRRRLKDLVSDLQVPEGMGVIVRTAGSERSKAEIKRDFEYLLRLWDEIRALTLNSTAPALVYEEGNLIKRSIRDLYTRDIEEVVVDGEDAYRAAKEFMKMLMPSHAKRIKLYRDPMVPLFHRYQIESQIDAIHSPVVQLRSGGYIVINPTEALVAIDVNSGRATRERNIEETAYKTNLEAAEEIARQLRLRDLAGLIVIDFIDMEEGRNIVQVERRLKDAMRHDRARIQIGRISAFGLMELSRQRLRPSLLEASTELCPHCGGTGHVRSTESTALHILRAIEEEGMRRRTAEIGLTMSTAVALYLLNHKRDALARAEQRYGCRIVIGRDDTLVPPAFRLDRLRSFTSEEIAALPVAPPPIPPEEEEDDIAAEEEEFEAEDRETVEPVRGRDMAPAAIAALAEEEQEAGAEAEAGTEREARPAGDDARGGRRRRRRRRRGDERGRPEPDRAPREAARDTETAPVIHEAGASEPASGATDDEAAEGESAPAPGAPHGDDPQHKRRRRGRRGGRRRRRGEHGEARPTAIEQREDAAAEFGGEAGAAATEELRVSEPFHFAPGAPSSEPVRHEPAARQSSSPAPETFHFAPGAPSSEPSEPKRSEPVAAAPEPEPPAAPKPEAPPRRGWWRR
jgi:ribonuclease E